MDRFQYRIVNLGVFNTAGRMVESFGRLGSVGRDLVGIYDKSSNWIVERRRATRCSSVWCLKESNRTVCGQSSRRRRMPVMSQLLARSPCSEGTEWIRVVR